MTKSPQPPDQPPRSARGREGGFVLVTILFVAAAIAISLSVTLPRAAMQAQRLREERLIYAGEQYKRAIDLYFRAHKKYPSEIDDLEETNGVRFLRRVYKDPLNENDEWRFIHMGADGRFKDSLIHDLEDPEEEGLSGSPGGSGIGGGRTGSSPGATNPLQAYVGTHQTPYAQTPYTVPDGSFRGADRARNVRESAAPEVVGQDQQPGWIPGQTAPNPNGQQLDENGNPIPPRDQDPNQNQQGQYPGTARTRPGQRPPNQLQPGYPGSQFGNQRNRNPRGANQVGGNPAGIGGIANPRGQAGGFGQGGSFGQGAGTQGAGFQGAGGQAADVIRGILTSPRPGGLAGIQNNRRAGGSGSSFKGGIAGVATKKQEMGVKVYEGREMYNEWEFVYDYRKDDRFGGVAAGPGGGMGAGMAGPAGALPAGQPGMGPSGALGGMPGTPASGAYPPGYPAGAPPPGQQPQNPYGALPASGPGVQQIPQQGFGQRGTQRMPQQGVRPPIPGSQPRMPFPGSTPGMQQQPGAPAGPDGGAVPRRRR
jgi:type II secretory pathway pseudopilin PulG